MIGPFGLRGGMAGSFPAPAPPAEGTVTLIDVETNGHGDHRTNATAFANPIATDVPRGIQYISWHSQDQMVWLASGPIGGPYTAVETNIGATFVEDAHNSMSLGVDPTTGDLLVSGDMHVAEMNFWRSDGPDDLDLIDWDTVPIASGGASLEASVTYPDFVLRETDNVFHFRTGGSGDGDLVRYIVNASGQVIDIEQLYDGEGVNSLYPHKFLHKDGNTYYAGCVRTLGGGYNSNKNLVAFYIDPDGNAWKFEGGAQTIPVTESNAGGVVTATNLGLQNVGSIAAFEDGRIITAAYDNALQDGFSQYRLRFIDEAGDWQTRVVPPEKSRQEWYPLSLVDDVDGILNTVRSSPMVLHKNGLTYLIFRSNSRGSGVWAWMTDDIDLNEWTLVHLDSSDIGDWSPQHDGTAWRDLGIVFMYYQKVVYSGSIGAQAVRVLKWVPPISVDFVAPATPFDPDTYASCVFASKAGKGRPGLKCNGNTDSANHGLVSDFYDERNGNAGFVQATPGDAPRFIYNTWSDGFGGVRFTKSTSDRVISVDATALAALDGTNQPFTITIALRPETLAANDTFLCWGNTGNVNHFISLNVAADGSGIRIQRRSGAAGTNGKSSAAGVLVAGQECLLTVHYDGTNVTVYKNGQVVIASTAWTSTGAMSLTHLVLGCQRTSTNSNFADFTLRSLDLRSAALGTSDRQGLEDAMGAEAGITITH